MPSVFLGKTNPQRRAHLRPLLLDFEGGLKTSPLYSQGTVPSTDWTKWLQSVEGCCCCCFWFYTCDIFGDDLWDGTKVATADADHADGRGQNVVDVAAKQATVFPQHWCCSPHLKACSGAKKAVNFRSKRTPDPITQSTFFFLLLKRKYFTPQNMPNATVLTLVLSLAVTTTAIFIFLPLLHSNQMFKYNRLVGFLLSKRRWDFQHVQWS